MIRLRGVLVIKALLLAAPVLSMVLMLSALWGIVGKATYADLDIPYQQKESKSKPAGNYFASGTNRQKACSAPELNRPDISGDVDKNDSPNQLVVPETIDWEHVI